MASGRSTYSPGEGLMKFDYMCGWLGSVRLDERRVVSEMP